MTTKTADESKKTYDSIIIKPIEKSRIEITGSIRVSIWEKNRAEALKYINNSVTVDGFRKGLIPENILIGKVGEKAILEEMAEISLSKAYMDIIIDNKIDAIGKPEIQITKLASGNPLEFNIITAVVPEVKLPDYKKIAKSEVEKGPKGEMKVTDTDIEEAILRIRKSKASHEGLDHEKMRSADRADGGAKEDHDKAIEASMPELTDDFVKTLGEFTDIPDFKNKLSAMLAEEKVNEAREKTRIRIADAIAEAVKVELPDIMIESELNRTQAQFEADMEHMGIKLEDYLKHAKKTQEEIRLEWKPLAEKKAKLQLMLNMISDKEKIQASPEEVEAEVAHIVEHYADADRERATVYAQTILTNEKVFQWLEKKE